jgi:predicted O-methyltransferase YrrM
VADATFSWTARVPETWRTGRHGLQALHGIPPGRLLDSRVRRLAIALSRPLRDDERRWVERIEEIRRHVEASTLEVPEKTTEPRTVGEIARRASKHRRQAQLLMKVVRDLRPASAVELGTCVGISAAYQAAALAMNGRGRLVTLEGYEVLSGVARGNLASLGLSAVVEVRQGRFADTLPTTLEEQPPDYGFIDGHHHEASTLAYYDAFARAARDRMVLVLDDISWSPGMRNAWRGIRDDPRTVVALTIEGRIGFCLVDGRAGREVTAGGTVAATTTAPR